MDDIDNLRGHALNCAVADALGWVQDKKHLRWWMDQEGKGHRILLDMDERVSRHVSPSIFDPAHCIEDAWTLGMDREWGIIENEEMTSSWVSAKEVAGVSLLFSDFPTRNEARAAAHTIAWLKAQQ